MDSLCSQLSRMIKDEKILAEQIKQVQKEVDELSVQYGGSIQVRFIRCGLSGAEVQTATAQGQRKGTGRTTTLSEEFLPAKSR